MQRQTSGSGPTPQSNPVTYNPMGANVGIALAVTLIAGLTTVVGSCIALFATHTNRVFLSIALGFSAGSMIYISFMELLPQALAQLGGDRDAMPSVLVAFTCGALVIALIDRVVPDFGNPHENLSVESLASSRSKSLYLSQTRLRRTAAFVAVTVALHNFPEGIAAFVVTVDEPALGIALGLAIALHNVPEGIAVSVPVYFATGSRVKAFYYSALSGLAEPLGAILAFLLLAPFMTPFVMGILLAAVAGVMVFIALDQMMPVARDYGHPHLVIYGLIGGMCIMGASLYALSVGAAT